MVAYYTSTILLAVVVSLIMILIVSCNVTISAEKRKLFMSTFAAVIVASLGEWGAFMLSGTGAGARLPIIICKLVEFSVTPATAVLYAAAFEDAGQKHMHMALKAVALHAAIELALAPFGLVFYVDESGVYCHGIMYAIYIGAYVASALYLLVETKHTSASFQYGNRWVPWAILIVVLTSSIIQMTNSDVRIVWLAMAICGCLLYLFYCGIIQQTDALTHLLNRYSYESGLAGLAVPAEVLFFDVDRFKEVNDGCGHAIGDQCLIAIGEAIYEIFGSVGSCYRIGGDEFCAIVTKNLDRAGIMESLLEVNLDKRRAEMPVLPTVSIGRAHFEPGQSDADAVSRQADQMMYESKRARKMAAGIPLTRAEAE